MKSLHHYQRRSTPCTTGHLSSQPSSPAGFRSSEEEPACGIRTAGEDSIWRQGSVACPPTETPAPGRQASVWNDPSREFIDFVLFSGLRIGWRARRPACPRATGDGKVPGRGEGGMVPEVGIVPGVGRSRRGWRARARSEHLRRETNWLIPHMRTGWQAFRQTCNLSNRQAGNLPRRPAADHADGQAGRLAAGQTGRQAPSRPCRQANMQTGNEAEMQAVHPIPRDRLLGEARSLWRARKNRQQR